MDWPLRRAMPGDAPALSLVAGASFLETFAGILSGDDMIAHVTTKSPPEVFARWIADPQSVVTMATHPDGDAPVGYAVLTSPEDIGETQAGDIELRRIYTLLTTRGTGLGSALMQRAMTDARAQGAQRLLLGVFAGNHRARAFYERQGFVVVAERQFKIGKTWHDDRVYAHDL